MKTRDVIRSRGEDDRLFLSLCALLRLQGCTDNARLVLGCAHFPNEHVLSDLGGGKEMSIRDTKCWLLERGNRTERNHRTGSGATTRELRWCLIAMPRQSDSHRVDCSVISSKRGCKSIIRGGGSTAFCWRSHTLPFHHRCSPWT